MFDIIDARCNHDVHEQRSAEAVTCFSGGGKIRRKTGRIRGLNRRRFNVTAPVWNEM